MKTRWMCFLLSFAFGLPAHAGILWDFTIAGVMMYNGEVVPESVTYRYDPDDLMTFSCAWSYPEPCTPPDWGVGMIQGGGGSAPYSYGLIYGATKAVMYSGAINGGSGPVAIRAFSDGGFGDYCEIGGTHIAEEGFSYCGWLPDPIIHPADFRSAIMFGGVSEGPVRLLTCMPACPGVPTELRGFTTSLTPVGLPEPGTLSLLAMMLAGIAASSRRSVAHFWHTRDDKPQFCALLWPHVT